MRNAMGKGCKCLTVMVRYLTRLGAKSHFLSTLYGSDSELTHRNSETGCLKSPMSDGATAVRQVGMPAATQFNPAIAVTMVPHRDASGLIQYTGVDRWT